MKAKEKNELIKWAETLKDSELLCEYYDTALESLGSQCDEMYDMGYDIVDIVEREEYEIYLRERCRILEGVCIQRGLELWK